ncbi:Growth-regulating factor 8 [Raphanus sativus]|uniref:Growth-regulating factor n=1 Tax=Raphanus sativus TaxID=3726 RepID=A0A6J0MZX5_RAPSA|nr:growth-regulating factor 8-like [Raphanus sativus]KAJ4899599.1 Growth-regulating factor 8 [Raphanus sativus]
MGTRAERNKEDFVGGLGFGVVEQHTHKDVVMLPSHHYHSYSSPSSASFRHCPAGGVGDTMFSASNTSEMFSLAGSNSAGSAASAVSVADPFFTLSSSEEMGRSMSGKESVAFSEAQWQELERQRNIYKYMMASLPVPSELLTPFSKNNPSHTNNNYQDVARGGSLKLGIIASNASNNNRADMEPWRCKRTDGKKWRCSRNAVPDHKYCERHAHKSRPRSRKQVETPSSHHNETRPTKNVTSRFAASAYPQFYGQPLSQFSAVSTTTTLPPASSSYDHHHHSGLRWLMKEGDSIATLNQEIHETAQLKVGSSRELKRGFDYDLNYRQNEPLVDQRFGALEGLLSPNQGETARRLFVEGEQDEAMGSSLTLSMAGGGGMEEGEGRSHQHQWISHEGPAWICSTTTPGGPLAEALCLGVSNNPSTSTTTTSSCSRSSG